MFAEPSASYHACIEQLLSKSICAAHNRTSLSLHESYVQRDSTSQLSSSLICCLSPGISEFSWSHPQTYRLSQLRTRCRIEEAKTHSSHLFVWSITASKVFLQLKALSVHLKLLNHFLSVSESSLLNRWKTEPLTEYSWFFP
jgi:hypothetical protein